VSLPHADTYAEALPDEDADATALPELHTNRNGGNPITHVNEHPDSDIGSVAHGSPVDLDAYTNRTLTYSDFTVTLDNTCRYIAAVTHTHDDGSEHDAIPIFTGSDCAYDCFDCGATFKPVVWRSEFKDIRR
jgi:hypothetical protein